MQFDESSALTKLFTNLVKAGKYTIDTVPAIGNLREAVQSVLKSQSPK